MLLNYLKVAIRSIFRNKLTAFINIAGLALAIACCLLIFLFIHDELQYDRYHSNADRIFRVTRNFLSQDGTVSLHLGHVAPPFGPLLKNDFVDIEEVARVLQYNVLFSIDEDSERKLSFNEPNTFVAEPSVLRIFSLTVLEGNPDEVLNRPFTVMLSDEMAMKYFGNESVQGKNLKVNNAFDLEVTGVFQSFPNQSHWHPDFLVSFSTLEDENIYGRQGLETNWGNNSFATYILVNDQFDPEKVQAQFPDFIDRHMGQTATANNYPMPSTWTNLFLQRLTDIHLHSHLDSEVEANGNINHVYMMGVIGLFIILIACFNFINLSTARATKRAKEVGLRKVAGAFRSQLIGQYLSESVLLTLFSLLLAIGAALLALPWLNHFTGKDLQLNLLQHAAAIAIIITTAAVLLGALAGIYPAFVLSAFRPALILKGQQIPAKGKGSIRKALVVLQFAISIALIIATVIILRQLAFINNRELGYAKDQVVTFRYYGDGLGESYDAFHNELVKSAAIKNSGRSSRIPTGRLLDSQGAQVQKGDTLAATNVVIKNVRVDHDFFDTYDIPMVSGRNFSKAVNTDDSLGFVLNESAIKMIGWNRDEAIGKTFQYGGVKGQVIGVVKDFHFESLHEPIIPVVFHISSFYNRLSVSIAGNDLQAGLAHIEKVWKEFLPQRPFEYSFLNDQYRKLYEGEQKQSQLFMIFAGLAIFIASLGLFGLATFNTLQRVKEIGIRKVMGASVASILKLLSKEIILLILLANIIAWPVAWYFMNQWLDGFAYRITISPGVYLLAASVAIIIALITVSTQTIKAAMTNPASTLRNE